MKDRVFQRIYFPVITWKKCDGSHRNLFSLHMNLPPAPPGCLSYTSRAGQPHTHCHRRASTGGCKRRGCKRRSSWTHSYTTYHAQHISEPWALSHVRSHTVLRKRMPNAHAVPQVQSYAHMEVFSRERLRAGASYIRVHLCTRAPLYTRPPTPLLWAVQRQHSIWPRCRSCPVTLGGSRPGGQYLNWVFVLYEP